MNNPTSVDVAAWAAVQVLIRLSHPSFFLLSESHWPSGTPQISHPHFFCFPICVFLGVPRDELAFKISPFSLLCPLAGRRVPQKRRAHRVNPAAPYSLAPLFLLVGGRKEASWTQQIAEIDIRNSLTGSIDTALIHTIVGIGIQQFYSAAHRTDNTM